MISIVFAFYLIRIINRSQPINIWRRLQIFKVLVIVLALTASYVLGANTIGLIVATGGYNLQSVAVGVAAIFVGSFFLSSGEIRRVSEGLLMRYPNATVTLLSSTISS